MQSDPVIGAVVIGRNEGDRLINCLESIIGQVPHVVYVDSGSTDRSVAAAHERGVTVVELGLDIPFTAARARNAGLEMLMAKHQVELVQFVDGDCEVQPGWIEAAQSFLSDHPAVAAVFGRRRERFPDASVYNRLCDWEWDTPIGETKACGGDVMMRLAPLRDSGGYNPALIAGEEPELCVRLREQGWQIWRLDQEMTLHDAAMTHMNQWWKRTRRAGHAFAEGAALHGAPPERHWVAETRKALIWGLAIPVMTLLAALIFGPLVLLAFAVYPLQFARLTLREGGDKAARQRAFFLVLGKFAEAQGVLQYWVGRLMGRQGKLIEYK